MLKLKSLTADAKKNPRVTLRNHSTNSLFLCKTNDRKHSKQNLRLMTPRQCKEDSVQLQLNTIGIKVRSRNELNLRQKRKSLSQRVSCRRFQVKSPVEVLSAEYLIGVYGGTFYSHLLNEQQASLTVSLGLANNLRCMNATNSWGKMTSHVGFKVGQTFFLVEDRPAAKESGRDRIVWQ